MKSWFNTVDKLKTLEDQFQKWQGTPFLANSCSPGFRGGGVSCQKLAAAIYRGVGLVEVDPPEVAMSHARFSRESLVEPWMDKRPEFERTPDLTQIQAGDLLGFVIGKAVHHLGIAQNSHVFFHVIEGQRAGFASRMDPTWATRLAVVWRPKP